MIESRLGRVHSGLVRVALGFQLFELGFRDHAGLEQLERTSVLAFRVNQRRAGGSQVGQWLGILESDQYFTALHPLAFIEQDFDQGSGDLRPYFYGFISPRIAERLRGEREWRNNGFADDDAGQLLRSGCRPMQQTQQLHEKQVSESSHSDLSSVTIGA